MAASNLEDDPRELRSRLRQLAEDKARLQAEYNLLSTLLDTTDVLVVMLDRAGKIVRFNQTFEQYVYLPNEKLVSKPIWDLPLYTPNGKILRERVKNIFDYVAFERRETFLVRADGSRRVIVWSNKSFYDDEGQIEYVISTGADITERKELEKLLEREQILLRSLIDSIPDAIFYKDTEGVYMGCNLTFAAMNGRSVQEIISGHTDLDFYPPELARTFIESDRQVLASRQVVQYENKVAKAGSPELILETRKSPYYGPGNEILGIIGVSRDVTRQKLAEAALRKANSEIEHLLASLPSILIVLSPEAQVIRWNPSAQKVLGVSAKDAVGQPLGQLPISWKWEIVADGIERCRKSIQPVSLEPVTFKRADGSEGLLGFGISPMCDSNQALSGLIVLGTDITERKMLEAQLAQAQKLESIGQLAAGIAHEINTPIQYVSDNTHFLQTSFADLLRILESYQQALSAARQGALTPARIAALEAAAPADDLAFLRQEIPTAIQQSLEGIQRVSEIVRAMKEFSHPGVIQKTVLDINKAVENTITVARNEWKYVAEIETVLAPNLPSIICQPGEINQVLLNIVVNAAQAIGEMVQAKKYDKGKITITTRQEGDWVEIRIRDNGPGIPEHIGRHIFDPFFTTKEVGKGTGQGLAIAYNIIVIKHGGTLTYETTPGSGTTFIIRLPTHPPEEEQS